MKKIILTALTVLMMFGLIGCSGDLHDKAALDISGFAVVGPNDSWDGSQKLTKVSDKEFTFEFIAKGETANLSLQLVPGSWDTRYCGDDNGTQKEITVGGAAATMVYYEGGDPKHVLVKGLEAGVTYKLIFKVTEDNDISVSVVSLKVPAVDADLSAINATTMEQPGAYIEIKGDNAGNALVGKYFFNKKGSDYVAVIPFSIANTVELADWGKPGYNAWGHIGVGDAVTVKTGDAQFKFKDGKLSFSDGDNINFSTITSGSKGVITVTASATGCTVVADVY